MNDDNPTMPMPRKQFDILVKHLKFIKKMVENVGYQSNEEILLALDECWEILLKFPPIDTQMEWPYELFSEIIGTLMEHIGKRMQSPRPQRRAAIELISTLLEDIFETKPFEDKSSDKGTSSQEFGRDYFIDMLKALLYHHLLVLAAQTHLHIHSSSSIETVYIDPYETDINQMLVRYLPSKVPQIIEEITVNFYQGLYRPRFM